MNMYNVKPLSAGPWAGGASPMSVTEPYIGKVHPRLDIAADCPTLLVTGKSTAGAFALAEPDLDVIVTGIIARVRASYCGLQDAVNVPPDVLRDHATYGLTGDPWQTYFECRTGFTIPAVGGTAVVLVIPLAIPRWNLQKEHPDANGISAGQLYSDSRYDLDTVAGVALPQNFVLANGTFAASAISADLRILHGGTRPYLWMAPAVKFFQRNSRTSNDETEGGPLFDELVFATKDTTQFIVINSNDNIVVNFDGRDWIKATPVDNLRGGYSLSVLADMLGVPGYDVAQNNKSSTARKGRVPFVYIPGAKKPTEGQLPAINTSRVLEFGAKSTAPIQLNFWHNTPWTSSENNAHLRAMMRDTRLTKYFKEGGISDSELSALQAADFGDLVIDGGGSGGEGAMNGDLALFKARSLRLNRRAGK